MAENWISFEEALKATDGQDRTLLLGNGFSIAWNKNIFSYRSLRAQAKTLGDDVEAVFDNLDTNDFEEVIQAYEHAAVICNSAGIENSFADTASKIKDVLIETIADNHPDYPGAIEDEQFTSCTQFLSNFSKIYSLNYDMLLYWVIMRDIAPENKKNSKLKHLTDGFAYNDETFLNWGGGDAKLHYPHGALHLFEHSELVKLNYRQTQESLKKQFIDLIKNQKKFPLFVSEGSSPKKLERIRSSGYLTRCLNSLRKIGVLSRPSPFFTFGFSFSDNDNHIIQAIQKNKCRDFYIGVHGDPKSDFNKKLISHAQKLSVDIGKHPSKINFFDSSDAKVWEAK